MAAIKFPDAPICAPACAGRRSETPMDLTDQAIAWVKLARRALRYERYQDALDLLDLVQRACGHALALIRGQCLGRELMRDELRKLNRRLGQ